MTKTEYDQRDPSILGQHEESYDQNELNQLLSAWNQDQLTSINFYLGVKEVPAIWPPNL